MNTQQGPVIAVDKAAAERRARAELRQSVWEASQFMSTAEIQQYVARVCNEIDDDAA